MARIDIEAILNIGEDDWEALGIHNVEIERLADDTVEAGLEKCREEQIALGRLEGLAGRIGGCSLRMLIEGGREPLYGTQLRFMCGSMTCPNILRPLEVARAVEQYMGERTGDLPPGA